MGGSWNVFNTAKCLLNWWFTVECINQDTLKYVIAIICTFYNGPQNVSASWTTIAVHSKNDQEVGVTHEVESPENQPQFPRWRW